ncbi:DNA primase [Immundisolibacter sp.]
MSGRIPEDFIDAVLARTDIVEVIGARVPLRRSGRELVGRCPFHEEKTPSFTVSPQKQFYHCFGCGAHGTVIGFLMAIDRLDFREAIAELAQHAGMALPRETPQPHESGASPAELYEVLAAASAFYRTQLRHHPSAAGAVEYLKQRGLDGRTAARFHLGFAPDGWDGLSQALGGRYGSDVLRHAGLLAGDDGGRGYDRFRGRVMFPIEDRRGRVLGFGGRILGQGEPKYLNSPETAVFHKGRELYGLPNVLTQARNPHTLLVVEGYMDVVMLAQHGIDNAAAVLGTALTAEQLRSAFRITPRLVLCFDGDNAGRRAAERAVDNALPELASGRDLRVLFLPEDEDPDSLVRRIGKEAFLEFTEQAVPVSQHLVDRLVGGTNLATDEGRAQLVELAKPLIEKLPPGTYRELIIEKISRLVGRAGWSVVPSACAPTRIPRIAGQRPSPVWRAVLLLAHYPNLVQQIGDLTPLAQIHPDGLDLLLRLLAALRELRQPRLDLLLEHWRDSADGAALSSILAHAEALPDEPAQAQRELQEILERLLSHAAQARRLNTLVRAVPPSQLDADQRAEVLALLNRRGGGQT